MSYIKNTDSLVEGSSQLFFTEQRAQDAVSAELQALETAIQAEESRAQSAEQSLDARLDVVEGSASTPGSIEKAKADAQAYADQKVADLVNSAPAVLDTLKELSDALGGDQNFAVTVSNQIGQVDDKVDQEISDRQAAVSAEQNRAQAAEGALDERLDVIEGIGEGSVAKAEQDAKDYADGLVSAEESARMAADASLSGRVSSLEADPTTKAYVDGEISAEQSARQSADSALSGRLDILEQDETTKAYVDQQVSAEQSARESADNLLDGRLDVIEGSGAGSVQKAQEDAEAYALGLVQAEESARQSAVSSEASARQSADSLLSGRLDALESDSVTKTYVDGEVSDLQGQITQEISDRQSAVSGEASARQSADSALSGRISVLETDPTTKAYVDGEVSDLQGQITQEISDRQAAVSAEQSARESAISALDLRVDQLELDPVSKAYVDGEVSDLQGQVNTEKGRIDAILLAADADKDSFAEIVSLINSVDAENDTAFAGYVTSNNAALAQEISDRQAGDSALDLRLDQLELDPVTKSFVESADDALQSNIDNLFGLKSTSDLSEGSNLYYTQARFDSAFGGKSTTHLSEGLNLYFTNARAKSAVVIDDSAGNETDQAMSVSAAKAYVDSEVAALEAEDLTLFKLDGSRQISGSVLFSDETKNIGSMGANRPGQVFVKDKLQIGGSIDAIPGNLGSMAFVSSDPSNNNTFRGVYFANSVDGCTMDLRKSRGTESAPTAVISGDRLGRLSFRGNQDTTAGGVFNNSSYMQAVAEETFSATARGSRLEFYTTTVGTTTIAERMRLQSGSLVINEPGNDYDFRVEGDNDQNLMFVDASTDRVGIGTATPSQKLDVNGVLKTNTLYSGQSNQSAPGYAFSGATNSGMFYDTNFVGIAVAGNKILDCSVTSVTAQRPVVMNQGYGMVRTATAANLTVTTSHGLVAVTDTSAARTLSLPSAVTAAGRHFIIKDETGAASATNYIRVQPGTSGQNLDGAAYYDIKVPYESLMVYSNGTHWFII